MIPSCLCNFCQLSSLVFDSGTVHHFFQCTIILTEEKLEKLAQLCSDYFTAVVLFGTVLCQALCGVLGIWSMLTRRKCLTNMEWD